MRGTAGPGGLAVDHTRRRLYVADAKLNKVLFYDLHSLQLVKAIGGSSASGEPEAAKFSAPTNLALDSRGRIYVTDTWNCRIQVFDPEGNFVLAFGTQGVQPGRFVRPKGIAIDSEDHVYVVDSEFNNFQIFTPEGKPLLFVGSAGTGPGEFTLPTGMTFFGLAHCPVSLAGHHFSYQNASGGASVPGSRGLVASTA